MEKYFTNCVVANEDRKTQLARGYPNIPANEEVKMIQEEYVNFYGVWCIVEWKGNCYYTSQRNIRKENKNEQHN